MPKDEMTVKDWFCKMQDGQILCGRTVGSFANIKGLAMDSLWVTYKGRKYPAPTLGTNKPLSFDFYVTMAIEQEGIKAKAYKLISLYPGCKLTRLVFADGRTEIHQELKR